MEGPVYHVRPEAISGGYLQAIGPLKQVLPKVSSHSAKMGPDE